jgi:hypothetical protein
MINDYLKIQTRKFAGILKELNADSQKNISKNDNTTLSYARLLEAMSRFYGFRNYATAKTQQFKALELHEWTIGKMAQAACPDAQIKVINAWLVDIIYQLSNQGSFNVNLYHEAMKHFEMTTPLAWPLNDREQKQFAQIQQALPVGVLACISKIPLKRYLGSGDYVRVYGSGSDEIDQHVFEVTGIAQQGIIASYIVKPVTGFEYNMAQSVGKSDEFVQQFLDKHKNRNHWQSLSLPENLLYPVKLH